MEVDEVVPSSHSQGLLDPSENKDVQLIRHKLQSMQLENVADICNAFGLLPAGNVSGIDKTDPELSESVKAFQQFLKEREDATFSRNCLFCKKHFTGNRYFLLNHLAEQHNFFMGHPDNLVYVNEFLDILESMLNKLQCLHCEKIFKDWSALKEHMRKKMHKGINPNNKTFDRFYMLNYLNKFNKVDLTCHDAEEETEIEMEPKDNSIVCLFCDSEYFDFDEVMNHMKVAHGYDFRAQKKCHNLDFYSQVKLINYIRRMVIRNECTICHETFESKESLTKHMTETGHIKILPLQEKWNQSEYFFSTLETDYLLCGLQDEDDDENESTVEVISEDIVIPKTSVLSDENLRRELL